MTSGGNKMKVLVIPDVRLKPWMFDEADYLLRQYEFDTVVCLGDLVDDWDKQTNLDLYINTIDRAIQFKHDHPNSQFCYGDHEVAYLLDYIYDNNSEAHKISIQNLLSKYIQAVEPRIAIKIDDVVFSHAGIEEHCYIACYNKSLICDNTVLKYMFDDDLSPLKLCPDPWIVYKKDFIQVVGHTMVKTIEHNKNVWFCDTFGTYRNNDVYGDQTFMVIDTITHKVTKYQHGVIIK